MSGTLGFPPPPLGMRGLPNANVRGSLSFYASLAWRIHQKHATVLTTVRKHVEKRADKHHYAQNGDYLPLAHYTFIPNRPHRLALPLRPSDVLSQTRTGLLLVMQIDILIESALN